MANAKQKRKRRKLIIFSAIGLAVAGLTLAAVFRKHEVLITVQTEKVKRRNITETVVANGRIQPVLQVKISPEVSGEIIELPVKEGQRVKKGDLLVKIKPDTYDANVKSAEAGYMSAVAGKDLADANMKKAQLEYERNQDLFQSKLISQSSFLEYKTSYEVAQAQAESAGHQVDVAKASLDRAKEELQKTTIVSPLEGTITKLNSRLGERVVGTSMMAGTEIMIISDLNEMESRVDITESDVVLIAPGQKASLEVDAFRDRKFPGTVTEIANSSNDSGQNASSSQEAPKFEVKIRINEKEDFRPGMSVTAEISTRYRTNVLSVPVQSVTTRPPKPAPKPGTNTVAGAGTNSVTATNAAAGTSRSAAAEKESGHGESKKSGEPPKPIEVVFVVEGDHVKMVPIKRGINDDNYAEIIDGLSEGQEVVSGPYKAISRELQDGSKIRKGPALELKEKK
jgi:HlyD family secretion protein